MNQPGIVAEPDWLSGNGVDAEGGVALGAGVVALVATQEAALLAAVCFSSLISSFLRIGQLHV